MLHLAELIGNNHNIKITCNGDVTASNIKTGGDAINFINSNLVGDTFERVVDMLCGSETIVMIYSGKTTGIVKQFWIVVDAED